MTSINDIEQNFEKAVFELPFFRQIAFAYCLAKRMYPHYVYFSENENFGNLLALQESINLLKEMAQKNLVFSQKIKKLVPKIEKSMPDTEEFGSFSASLALDACGLILESLSAILQNDSKSLSAIAFIPIAAAEMRNRFHEIQDQHLILQEIQFQEKLITELKNTELSEVFWNEN